MSRKNFIDYNYGGREYARGRTEYDRWYNKVNQIILKRLSHFAHHRYQVNNGLGISERIQVYLYDNTLSTLSAWGCRLSAVFQFHI